MPYNTRWWEKGANEDDEADPFAPPEKPAPVARTSPKAIRRPRGGRGYVSPEVIRLREKIEAKRGTHPLSGIHGPGGPTQGGWMPPSYQGPPPPHTGEPWKLPDDEIEDFQAQLDGSLGSSQAFRNGIVDGHSELPDWSAYPGKFATPPLISDPNVMEYLDGINPENEFIAHGGSLKDLENRSFDGEAEEFSTLYAFMMMLPKKRNQLMKEYGWSPQMREITSLVVNEAIALEEEKRRQQREGTQPVGVGGALTHISHSILQYQKALFGTLAEFAGGNVPENFDDAIKSWNDRHWAIRGSVEYGADFLIGAGVVTKGLTGVRGIGSLASKAAILGSEAGVRKTAGGFARGLGKFPLFPGRDQAIERLYGIMEGFLLPFTYKRGRPLGRTPLAEDPEGYRMIRGIIEATEDVTKYAANRGKVLGDVELAQIRDGDKYIASTQKNLLDYLDEGIARAKAKWVKEGSPTDSASKAAMTFAQRRKSALALEITRYISRARLAISNGTTGFHMGENGKMYDKAATSLSRLIAILKLEPSTVMGRDGHHFFKNTTFRRGKDGKPIPFYKPGAEGKGNVFNPDFKVLTADGKTVQRFANTDFENLWWFIDNSGLQRYDVDSAKTALANLFKSNKTPSPGDIENLEMIFGAGLSKELRRTRGLGHGIYTQVMDVINIPRSTMASIDLSFAMRQGWVAGPRHPKAFGSMVKQQAQTWADPNHAKAMDALIRSHPYHSLGVQAGLYHAPIGFGAGRAAAVAFSKRDEAFMSSWSQRIPGIGQLVRRSELAFNTAGNKFRTDMFNHRVAKWIEHEGVDSVYVGAKTDDLGNIVSFKGVHDRVKNLASWTNIVTGRGELGPAENLAPILSSIFFSPRFTMSRLQVPIKGAGYALGLKDSGIRREVTEDMVSWVSANMGILSAASLIPGVTVVMDDPWNSDFGQIRYGDTRLDLWAGEAQVARLVAQMIFAQRTNTTTNETYSLVDSGPLGDEGGIDQTAEAKARAKIFAEFFARKLSPQAQAVRELVLPGTIPPEWKAIPPGTEGRFQKFYEVLNEAFPLFLQDMHSAIKHDGWGGGFMGMGSMIGLGVNSYSNPLNDARNKRILALSRRPGGEKRYLDSNGDPLPYHHLPKGYKDQVDADEEVKALREAYRDQGLSLDSAYREVRFVELEEKRTHLQNTFSKTLEGNIEFQADGQVRWTKSGAPPLYGEAYRNEIQEYLRENAEAASFMDPATTIGKAMEKQLKENRSRDPDMNQYSGWDAYAALYWSTQPQPTQFKEEHRWITGGEDMTFGDTKTPPPHISGPDSVIPRRDYELRDAKRADILESARSYGGDELVKYIQDEYWNKHRFQNDNVRKAVEHYEEFHRDLNDRKWFNLWDTGEGDVWNKMPNVEGGPDREWFNSTIGTGPPGSDTEVDYSQYISQMAFYMSYKNAVLIGGEAAGDAYIKKRVNETKLLSHAGDQPIPISFTTSDRKHYFDTWIGNFDSRLAMRQRQIRYKDFGFDSNLSLYGYGGGGGSPINPSLKAELLMASMTKDYTGGLPFKTQTQTSTTQNIKKSIDLLGFNPSHGVLATQRMTDIWKNAIEDWVRATSPPTPGGSVDADFGLLRAVSTMTDMNLQLIAANVAATKTRVGLRGGGGTVDTTMHGQENFLQYEGPGYQLQQQAREILRVIDSRSVNWGQGGYPHGGSTR